MAVVFELVIKWVIGGILGAISTLFLIFKKDIIEYIKYQRKKRKKELLQDVSINMENLEDKMEHHEEEISQEFKEHDRLYLKKISELEEKIMAILIPIQEATLSSHYDALLEKCKKFIKQGSISADELELLEKDYATYKSLNGNGHMLMWITRVRNLQVT